MDDIGAVELADGQFLGADASAKRKQKQKGKKVVVAVQAVATERATATAGGAIKVGKKSFPSPLRRLRWTRVQRRC